ncbi:MAG: hypothetical protein NTY50_18295 [Methylobacter sp.]|nr:hypothetical protein [Methylobacter sp.]
MKKHQRGFSLVSAIFLLVIIAALGLFTVTISTTQQQSSAIDVLGSRAYQAAKAGIEWSIYQITNPTIRATCATLVQPIMPAGTQLSAFTVVVNCSSTGPYLDGTANFSVYELTSTATTAGAVVGSLGYLERQVRVTITN